MEFVNRTPFTLAPMPGRFGYPAHSATFVVKATIALVHDGVSVPREDQPFPTGDQPYDDDDEGLGAPRYEMDFSPFKPAADVLLVGHCHAPGGVATSRCEAGLALSGRRMGLHVSGDRYWQHGPMGARPSEPLPFTAMPLRYERAYGGPEDPRNPVGVGFGAEQVLAAGDTRMRLPNIEFPDRLIHSPADDPGPAGFGPVSRRSLLRTRYQGTYDARWEAQRWPWYPEDFDWRFWNASPVSFGNGYLVGDESLTLTHLHPRYPEFHTRLPDIRSRLFVERPGVADQALEEVPLNLDTLWIDADAETAVLLWRGICAVADPQLSDICRIYLDAEQASAAPRPPGYFQGRYRQRLAEIEDEWRIEEESPPPSDDGESLADGEDADRSPDADGQAATAEEPDEEAMVAEALSKARAQVDDLPPPEFEAADLETVHRFQQEHGQVPEEGLMATGDEEEDDPDASSAESAWTRAGVEGLGRDVSLAGEDLSGLDLSGIDFTGRDMDGVILDGANLSRASLDGARLTGASLTGAALDQASFTGAWLVDASLARASGAAVDFSAARLLRAHLSGAQFTDATFRGALLNDADLTDASLIGTDFTGAKLDGAQFERASLRAARLDDAAATDASFAEAVMTRMSARGACFFETDFSGASLPAADLRNADLRNARMEGVQAPRVRLDGADLTGLRASEQADFAGLCGRRARASGSYWEGASLGEADFTEADLRETDFSGANLQQACLERVDAAGARFIAATLEGASLRQANLFNGSLERASLAGADLSGANCYGVEFLDADWARAFLQDANVHMTKLAGGTAHGGG